MRWKNGFTGHPLAHFRPPSLGTSIAFCTIGNVSSLSCAGRFSHSTTMLMSPNAPLSKRIGVTFTLLDALLPSPSTLT